MQQIIFSFHFHLTQHVSALYGHLQVSESVEILIGNFNWFCNNIWTVACVILTHIDAVWQFRQIQTPEDGHLGAKHVVLSESGKTK
jgi:hypothetical protein